MSPPPSAYGAQPFDVCEIDAHSDADRLWATIVAIRANAEAAIDEIAEQLAVPSFVIEVNSTGAINMRIRGDCDVAAINDAITEMCNALYEPVNSAADEALATVLDSAELDGRTDPHSGEIVFTADKLPDGPADHIIDFIDRLAAIANRLTGEQS